MKKAWIYIRVAKDSEDAVQHQKEQLEQYCRDNNLLVIGSTETNHAGEAAQAQFDRALNEMLRNTPDVMVVESASKLARNTVEALAMVRALESMGIDFHTVRDGCLSRSASELHDDMSADENSNLDDEASDPRIDRFLESVNKLLRHADFDDLHISCNSENSGAARNFLKQMHDAFVRVYGDKPLSAADAEFVEMPAVIQGHNGMLCLGLVGVDLQSSGEHWGTDFFTPHGVISQGEALPERQMEFINGLIPYSYWYTPEIENDIHVDFSDIPENVASILEECRGLNASESQVLS